MNSVTKINIKVTNEYKTRITMGRQLLESRMQMIKKTNWRRGWAIQNRNTMFTRAMIKADSLAVKNLRMLPTSGIFMTTTELCVLAKKWSANV